MSDPLYELAQLIADCEAILEELLLAQKRILAKQFHVKVADLTIDGVPSTFTVTGYGTVGTSNPSDSTIDSWTAQECDSFASACKAQAEQAGGSG